MMKVIEEALARGDKALSEHDSKALLDAYDIPVTHEVVVTSVEDAKAFANKVGYPVVLKGSSTTMTHKTELNLVELGIKDDAALEKAYAAISERGGKELDGILVQEMIQGSRELVAGLVTDPQFGPTVMFGLGGIYTEVLKDVTFRVAPLSETDARNMIEEFRAHKMLDKFRGKPAVDKDLLVKILMNLGRLGLENPEIAEIDINPFIVCDSKPVAVDALVILKQK
ncbi:MAG: succinyl-CoA synthetase subunit beta [Deltaproteobacteria bacterium ADurb.Bin510]|nr:MAG: succinyl-CoA synthetase subunit beta [Deltaproteobacteria bacterium ADurb.Bin510]